MNRMLKKAISILLTCAMIVTCFPTLVLAEGVIPEETGYTGIEVSVNEPSSNPSSEEDPELEGMEGTVVPMSGIVLFDAGDEQFTKVTSASSFVVGGQYLFAAESGGESHFLTNEVVSNWALPHSIDTPTGNTLTAAEDAAYVWTLEAGSESGTFYLTSGGGYLTFNNNSNSAQVNSTPRNWIITFADGKATLSAWDPSASSGAGATRTLRYNTDSSGLRFRAYTGTTGIGALTVYVLGDGTVTTNTAPTATPAAGVVESGAEVTLSAEAGCTIYYTIDGSTPTTASTAYTTPITLSTLPATIKAIAVGNSLSDSAIATFTYTEASPITVLEARQKPVGATEIFTQGIVTYVSGRNITVQDSTGGIAVYAGAAVSGLNVGDEITVKGTVAVYGELIQLNAPVADIAVISTSNPAPAPIIKTIAELQAAVGSHALESRLIKLENVYVSVLPSTGTTMSITFVDDDGNAIQGRNLINDAFDSQITMGAKVDVVASFARFNAAAQLAGYTSGVEFVSAAAAVLPLSSNTADGTVLDAGDEITVTTATPGATIEYNTTAGDFTGTWTAVPAGGIVVAGEPGDNITYYIRAEAAGLADATLTISVQIRPSSGTIAEVRERREGALASVEGIVTAILDGSIGLVSVQDSTGAILMKLPTGATFAAGDPISIVNATVSTHTDGAIMLEDGTATTGTYSDGCAVYPITFNDTISPARISDLESMLVKMYDMEYVGVEDGMRLLRDADGKYAYVEATGSFTVGSFYHVTGILMRDGAYAKLVVDASSPLTSVDYVGAAQNDAWQGTAVAIFANTLSTGGTAPLPVAASGGSNAAGAELTTNTNVTLTAGGGVGGTTGWNSGQYFQYKLSTEGFVNLKLSVSGRDRKSTRLNSSH